MSESRGSKRFKPTFWSERVVPALLIILVLVLVATLILVGLSVLGLTPGG